MATKTKNITNLSMSEIGENCQKVKQMSTSVVDTVTPIGDIYLSSGNIKIYPNPTNQNEYVTINATTDNSGAIYKYTENNKIFTCIGRPGGNLFDCPELNSKYKVHYYAFYIDQQNNLWLGVSIELISTSQYTASTNVTLSKAYGPKVKLWHDDYGHKSLATLSCYEYGITWLDGKELRKEYYVATALFDSASEGVKNIYVQNGSYYDYNLGYCTGTYEGNNYDVHFTKEKAWITANVTFNNIGNNRKVIKGFILAKSGDSNPIYKFSLNGNVQTKDHPGLDGDPNATAPSSKPAGDGGGDGDDTEPKDPFDTVNETTKWFAENISSPQYAEEEQYFNEMYGGYQTVWSTRSFRSIIGMPFHFLMNKIEVKDNMSFTTYFFYFIM